MDSILVVCYSYTGVTRRAAQLLASHHGWPLGEVRDVHRRAGAAGYLRSVLDSLLRRRPEIAYEGPDPGDFRTVVLAAPIWMYRLAGPMRSFVTGYRADLRRVAVLCTMGGAGATNAFTEIAHLLGHAPIRCAAFTQAAVENGSCTNDLLAFGDALQPGTTATQAAPPGAWTPPPTEPLPEQP